MLAQGFGFHDGSVVACPIGTYNSELRNDSVTPCTTCPVGLTTSLSGSVSVSGCDQLLPGYGCSNDTTCDLLCGDSVATFGPAGRNSGEACVDCPEATAGFLFDYGGDMNVYVPILVAREGADTGGDCLSEFVQWGAEPAWYVGGNVSLTKVSSAANFSACVADCKADATCQYVTFDYDAADGSKCSKKQAAVNGR